MGSVDKKPPSLEESRTVSGAFVPNFFSNRRPEVLVVVVNGRPVLTVSLVTSALSCPRMARATHVVSRHLVTPHRIKKHGRPVLTGALLVTACPRMARATRSPSSPGHACPLTGLFILQVDVRGLGIEHFIPLLGLAEGWQAWKQASSKQSLS